MTTEPRRQIRVWTEGQGEHWVDADDDRQRRSREPSALDWADGDNPMPNWNDWHGMDEPPCY